MLAMVSPVKPSADRLLQIHAEEDGSRTVVHLQGEVDICTASRLRGHLADVMEGDGLAALVLDLSGLEFMDATGLEVLVQARRRAGEQGAQLVLAHPPGIVRRLLEATGLDGAFLVEPDREGGPAAV